MKTSSGLVMLAAVLAIPALPAHAASPVLEATYSSAISNGWVRVERWRDPGAAFTQETFPPDGRGDQSGQRVTFFVGDSAVVAVNHLELGWDTPAVNQIKTWLNAP